VATFFIPLAAALWDTLSQAASLIQVALSMAAGLVVVFTLGDCTSAVFYTHSVARPSRPAC